MARVFHRLRPTLALLSSLILCLFTLQASGSPADLTYRSTVSEVRLTFFATDQQNRGVETLQSGDVAVVDDGLVIRQFRSFSRADVTHLEIVLLVDVSQSVVSRYHQEIAGVLQLISDTPSISGDHISVISFSGMRETVVCSGNCRDASVADHLLGTKADGATPLWDALQFAGNFVAQRRAADARPVIILFSDGNDTISRVPSDDALQAVIDSEAQIDVVDLNDPRHYAGGAAVLSDLADATGGSHLLVNQGAAEILRAVLEDLHSGYLVTYKLPNSAAGLHLVRILPTSNLNLKFRCRRGYNYESANR
jgi:VWFA-related protein